MKTLAFTNYLEEPYSLDLLKMQELHEEMLGEIGENDGALELYQELLVPATKYAAIRASWMQLSLEKKAETGEARTSCHDSVIIRFNALAKYLRMQGKPAAWRDELGDENEHRKTIGDFACYIVFVNSLCAR